MSPETKVHRVLQKECLKTWHVKPTSAYLKDCSSLRNLTRILPVCSRMTDTRPSSHYCSRTGGAGTWRSTDGRLCSHWLPESDLVSFQNTSHSRWDLSLASRIVSSPDPFRMYSSIRSSPCSLPPNEPVPNRNCRTGCRYGHCLEPWNASDNWWSSGSHLRGFLRSPCKGPRTNSCFHQSFRIPSK